MAITAGAFAARVAEVEVTNAEVTTLAGATWVPVEKLNSPRLSGNNDTAESSSNDSGGSKEKVYTWDDASITFEMIVDEAAVGQEHIWTAYEDKEIRGFRLKPRGVLVDNKQVSFLGLVTNIEESLDKADVGKYNVTVQKTGPMVRDAQTA